MTTKNALTHQEVLARFKENHPDLNSVSKITQRYRNEREFVDRYRSELAGGDREARRIYRTAVNLKERSVLLWANLRDASSPYLGQTLFDNLPKNLSKNFLEKQASIPQYEKLFGNLDETECDHHRSIFGPTAYFVDLMRFVEQYITGQNGAIPNASALELRRPDLSRIRLDAENTSDLIPYIDLVNELLEAFVGGTQSAGNSDDLLRVMTFPMSLPFDLPLTEVRRYLRAFDTSLYDVQNTLRPLEGENERASQRLLARESLDLSAEEAELISAPVPDPGQLSGILAELFGMQLDASDALPSGRDGLANIEVFLARTGLTRERLNELLYGNLDQHEVNAGLTRVFFVNDVDDGLGHLEVQPDAVDAVTPPGSGQAAEPYDRLLNLSELKLDRIHRFLRLARKLDWSFTELDRALRSLAPDPVAETALLLDGINDHVSCGPVGSQQGVSGSPLPMDGSFTIEAWVEPSRSGRHAILSRGAPGPDQPRFLLWIDAHGRLALHVEATGGESFELHSVRPILARVFTHVALVVSKPDKSVRFVIDGEIDQGKVLSRSPSAVGETLEIGRDLNDLCFAGVIKDVRIWAEARDPEHIARDRYRRRAVFEALPEVPGLIGYWPLIESVDGRLDDLSGSGNHGRPGGAEFVTQPRWVRRDLMLDPLPQTLTSPLPREDYVPVPENPGRVLPEPPYAFQTNVLELDGENDVVVIKNDRNFGLGRLDKLTLEFWFQAIKLTKRSNRRQVLFTQGDAEAGLSVYLHKKKLHVLQWCNSFEGDDFRASWLRHDAPIEDDVWHHLAIVHDEFPDAATSPPVDIIEFRAYIDATSLLTADGVDHAAGFRLSPVGPLCLGGVATGKVTAFEKGSTKSGDEDAHCFSGRFAELRLWRTIRSVQELEEERNSAARPTPDLVAHLPLEEYREQGAGQAWRLMDLAGERHGNRYAGTLQLRQIALQSKRSDPQLLNIHSHFDKPEALEWKDYVFAGRMRMSGSKDAIGVTFLSRHNEGIDQYYRLGRNADHPAFNLTAHPVGVQILKSADASIDGTVSRLRPKVKLWYRFLISVEDTGTRTTIKAKLWPDGDDEPADFQIEAYDDNPDIRITSGTVGVWTDGRGKKARQFDSLCVWPAAIVDPTPADLLLDIDFEDDARLPEPEHWSDTGNRVIVPDEDGWFGLLGSDEASSRPIWGTRSELPNLHAYYLNPDVDSKGWRDYTYTGQMRIDDAAGGIGVTFLNRSGDGIDQHYSLSRDADHPAFHLSAHPHGVQPLASTSPNDAIESALVPQPDAWYRFHVEVLSDSTESRTLIRAKIWAADAEPPAVFQMTAHDQSGIRLEAGTVGVWTTGAGAKHFDRLDVVEKQLLAESFDAYQPEQEPQDWRNTGKRNIRDEVPSLFQTALLDEAPVFGTTSDELNIHSHYSGADALEWSNYRYTGRFFMSDPKSGIGVTFLSRYPDDTVEDGEHDYYYRLRRFPGQPSFKITSHRGDGTAAASLIKGEIDTGIEPRANTWYRFRVDVEDTGTRTSIRANVWPESQSEPVGFQVDAYDDDADRLTRGTVGLWCGHKGAKYFDDLQVVQGLLQSGGENELFAESPSRLFHEPDESLFEAVDTQDNLLRWKTLSTLPLLRRPLGEYALRFDGERQALVGVIDPATPLSAVTLEAWIRPAAQRAQTLVSLEGTVNDKAGRITLSADVKGRLVLTVGETSLVGAVAMPSVASATADVHVAARIENTTVILLVDGRTVPEGSTETPEALLLPAPFEMQLSGIELGHSPDGSYFDGSIREVRLWSTALDDEQILAGRHQRPDESSALLLGYWPLGEVHPDPAPGRGSLETSLSPLVPSLPLPDGIALTDTGFWRAQRRVLTFDHRINGQDVLDHAEPVTAVDEHHQRTFEVCFLVHDKGVTQRKQVIFHEGDWQRGLVLYIHDGALHFVGYNAPADESGWRPTHEENWQLHPQDRRRVWRLKTDRIESGRWHHAALVLDGRDEVRPAAMRAFVDGKAVLAGPGSKLWQHTGNFSLGGVSGSVRFHDHTSEDAPSFDSTSTGMPGHALEGAVMYLRLWNRALSFDEIASGRTRDIDAPQVGLELAWNFDDSNGTRIIDASGHGRDGHLDRSDRLKTLRQSLQGSPLYRFTPIVLDHVTLEKMADVKRLKDEHGQSIEQLTSLWFDLASVGRAQGPSFFDRLFNPEGETAELWHSHPLRPVRWDRTGQENRDRDRRTRSRLMQSLRVSSRDLDVLVTRLSSDEPIVEMDTDYLTRLYRLATLPRLLGMTVSELLVLLEQLGLSSIESLSDVTLLSDRAAWLKRTGITVAELVFFGKSVTKAHAEFYADSDLRTLARSLEEQSRDVLVGSDAFTTTVISEAQSRAIFEFLLQAKLLEPVDVSGPSDQGTISRRSESLAAVKVGSSLDTFDKLLDHLSERERWTDEQRLERQPQIIAEVQATLARFERALPETITQGLADWFEVSADRVNVVVEHLRRAGDGTAEAANFIRQIRLLDSVDSAVPLSLSVHLASMGKLLHLLVRFELDSSEAGTLLQRPGILLEQPSDALHPTLSDLDRLSHFQQLKAAFEDDGGQLIQLLGEDPVNLSQPGVTVDNVWVRRMSELAGWQPRQLITLAAALGNDNHNRVEVLSRLNAGIDLARSMGCDVDFLIELAGADSKDIEFRRRQASALRQVLRAQVGKDDWGRTHKPIRDAIAVQKRDALLAVAMQRLKADFGGRLQPDILYEYFLLDVQTGSEVDTSRIVQASASLQLYVQRCLMNLEANVDPGTIPLTEWEWVKNYRVWEANRKVFLYPENYIEPELRRNKSPLFEELEHNLSQVDLNQEAVEKAYVNYLDRFSELARLKIVGSYLHRDLPGDPAENDETLYLIGRTRTQPRLYHLRKHVTTGQGERWLPWETIDVAINADVATPVHAFGKLLLFWVEFTKLMESRDRRLSDAVLSLYPGNVLQSLFMPSLPDDTQQIKEFRKTFDRIIAAILSAQTDLTEEEIKRLQRGDWTIDKDGYLYDTRIVGRVQRNVNIYKAEIKYSYYNFDRRWIPPQVYFEKVLTEEQYGDVQWHSLYVQRTRQLAFEPGQVLPPLVESNPKVLQIDEGTRLAVVVPRSTMKQLTWSFWARRITLGPQLHQGISAPERQELTLLDYNNASLVIKASNDFTAIAGARARENRVGEAVSALEAVLVLSGQTSFHAAADELSRIRSAFATPVAAVGNVTEWGAYVSKINEHFGTGDGAIAAQQSARAARAQQASDADAKEREFASLWQDVLPSIQLALTLSRTQLDREMEAPKWESKDWTLSVRLTGSNDVVFTTLEVDHWQHVALQLQRATGRDGYDVTLIQHRHTDSSDRETKGFLSGAVLAQRALLEIGKQAETDALFGAQMAELRLWNRSRSGAAIRSERLQRKVSETGLFSLPLNVQVESSTMTRVPSPELTFTTPVAFTGELSERLAARERIIVFYGDQIGSIRDNLEEQSFALTSVPQTATRSLDVSLMQAASGRPTDVVLSLIETDGLFVSDAVSANHDGLTLTRSGSVLPGPLAQRTMPADASDGPGKIVLGKLASREVTFLDVHNRPGWYIVDTGDDQFLMRSIFLDTAGSELPVPTAAELMKVQFDDSANTLDSATQAISVSFGLRSNQAPAAAHVAKVEFRFERLSTYAIHELSQNLFTGGIDKFLSPASQASREIDFQAAYLPNAAYVPEEDNRIPDTIDFEGSCRLYFEEIFFHIPFLIANRLNQSQRFADAQKWYHYLFDPTTQTEPGSAGNDSAIERDRYWRYLPFRGRSAKSMEALLTQSEALTAYREDPFDPHAIAALRMTTYQKAVVMKYIDNLLDWGDSLFAQDTRESITEATLLYVLAFNLLGPRPKSKPLREHAKIGTYDHFVATHADSDIEFFTEHERETPAGGASISLSPHAHLITHFCVPENQKFKGYWDLVDDRLYKVRHSLNIEGVFRQLALFQPPIDPAALVNAVSRGAGIGGALADLSASVPHYRHGSVLAQAKEVTGMLGEMGGALLAALESHDDGKLALLQHTHERNLLELVTNVKTLELGEAKETLEALQINRQNVDDRREYYRGLSEDGTEGLSLSAAEASAITFRNTARGLRLGIGITDILANIAKALPEVEFGASGFGGSPLATATLKGETLAAAFDAQGAVVSLVADTLDIGADMSQEIGEYQRRLEEWKYEKAAAELDLQEIDQQILAAQTGLARMEIEQRIHDKEISQNREVADYLRGKFTNGELRGWMVGRLSGLYFQGYKLAYDLAKAAEKGLQFELPTTQSLITPGHWDNLRKGLLAADSLMLELNRMDKVRLDQDSRFQEIEKSISLKRSFPEAFAILQQKGSCEFSLGERLFNQDFPGHYCRLIKTVALSVIVDGEIDAFDAVHASLSQSGNKTLLLPDANAVGYLMNAEGDQPDNSTLRVNWRANQQIAISKVSEDLGMFNLDFVFDDRYFPFEGTGAVSTWQFEMPLENNLSLVRKRRGQADQLRITDVIVHLRYTSKFDRGVFRQSVREMMQGQV